LVKFLLWNKILYEKDVESIIVGGSIEKRNRKNPTGRPSGFLLYCVIAFFVLRQNGAISVSKEINNFPLLPGNMPEDARR